jgi:hypothetical protein
VDELGTYRDLVEDVAVSLDMGAVWVDQAQRVFRVRNQVVHDDRVTTHDEAGRCS